jgi:hypothetical protein
LLPSTFLDHRLDALHRDDRTTTGRGYDLPSFPYLSCRRVSRLFLPHRR